MGRHLLIVAISFLALAAACGQGQPTPHFRPRAFGRGNSPTNGARDRDRLFQLSPDERQMFRHNAERWLQMNPEQQKLLRQREQARRRQILGEAEAAMHSMGLRLDPNAQGQFEARYSQERRKMERALRQEVEAKRREQLPQLNERLKNEFQSRQSSASEAATAAPSASPASSAKPRE